MYLKLTNLRQGFYVTRLAEASRIAAHRRMPGTIADDGEVFATVDVLGVLRDLDGHHIDLTEEA